MAAVTNSVDLLWNDLTPAGRGLGLLWDDLITVGQELGLGWQDFQAVPSSLLARWVVCALAAERARGLVGAPAALEDSGSFIYQDSYDQVYTTSWERQGGLLDFTVIVQQPYVWDAPAEGHRGPDGNLYRKGVVTVHRTVLRPLAEGYELVAEGSSQYVDVFPVSFRCRARPVDPFRYHLGSNVTDDFEHTVADGPRWADPGLAGDSVAVWGAVDSGGAVAAGAGVLEFVDVWGNASNALSEFSYEFNAEFV